MYTGKPVFAQVMDHLPTRTLRRRVERHSIRGGPRPGDRALERRPDDQGRDRRGRARLPCALHDPSRPGARHICAAGLDRHEFLFS